MLPKLVILKGVKMDFVNVNKFNKKIIMITYFDYL